MNDNPPILADLICEWGQRADAAEARADRQSGRLDDVATLHAAAPDRTCVVCGVPSPCPTVRVARGEAPLAAASLAQATATRSTRAEPAVETSNDEPATPALPSADELFGGSKRGVDRFFDVIGRGSSTG